MENDSNEQINNTNQTDNSGTESKGSENITPSEDSGKEKEQIGELSIKEQKKRAKEIKERLKSLRSDTFNEPTNSIPPVIPNEPVKVYMETKFKNVKRIIIYLITIVYITAFYISYRERKVYNEDTQSKEIVSYVFLMNSHYDEYSDSDRYGYKTFMVLLISSFILLLRQVWIDYIKGQFTIVKKSTSQHNEC